MVNAKKIPSIQIHPDATNITDIPIPVFNKIAVALDFTDNDKKLIAYALGQGKQNTSYLFIHVVESASAKLFGKESDDYETITDQEHMNIYINKLRLANIEVDGVLGFRNRAKEIVRIVKEYNADMLVVGAHGHSGLKDLIYGETINTVRHDLRIPVLVVNV